MADDGRSAVHTDPEDRPIWVRRRDRAAGRDDCQRGGGGPSGVIGLIALGVEDRHDAIPGELLDDATGREDHRYDRRPVLVEHRDHIGRLARLAERRERRKVGEEHADVPLLATEPGWSRSLTDLACRARRQVRPERVVETTQLPGRLAEQGDLVGRRTLAPKVRQHPVGWLAAGFGSGHGGDRPRVPAIDPAQGRFEIEAAEGPGERSASPVLASRAKRYRDEREEHQHVPLPPARVPVPADRDRDRRLAKERECEGDREEQDAAAVPVDLDAAPGRERVERDGHHRDDGEDPGGLLRRRRTVERRNGRQGEDRPDHHRHNQDREHRGAPAEDRRGSWTGQRAARRRGKPGGDDQSDRRRNNEPNVRLRQQHGRRRECVEPEEAGAREERHRDQDDPRVAVAASRDIRDVRQRDVDRSRREDQPEVARVMLPDDIERRLSKKQRQTNERKRHRQPERPRHWSHRRACRSLRLGTARHGQRISS